MARKRIPAIERFWTKVERTGHDECWLWCGARNERGYGMILGDERRLVKAHRLIYEHEHGPVAADLVVMHLCDNPACVNPAHLRAGTSQENIQDWRDKGSPPRTDPPPKPFQPARYSEPAPKPQKPHREPRVTFVIRKRCKHAGGLTGRGKMRAWRACRCAWGIDLHIHGQRLWHNLGHDEAAAKVAALRLRADHAEGRHIRRRSGDGVADILDAWLTHKTVHARPNSVPVYRSRVKRLTRYFGDTPAGAVTTDDVRRMAEDFHAAGLSPATVNITVAALSAAWKHARRNGTQVPTIDFADATIPSGKDAGRPWLMTLDQCVTAIESCKDPVLASMMEFALLTGLRRGEILGLKATDVAGTVVHVDRTLNHLKDTNPPKTRNGVRAVTLTPRCLELVQDRAAGVDADGRLWPYTLHTATDALLEHLQMIGLHVKGRGWHCFRHAHTAALDQAGVSLRDAAARLGHGANYAQSASYGWASEQTDVTAVDAVISRHGAPPGRGASLDPSRRGE